MKIRGHGNGLAIALSAIAVVFAASGTAYAVTATTVNIADPSAPARVAKVDNSGRLSTAGATSTVNVYASIFPTSDHGDLFSAPTTATLAVSKFSVSALAPTSATYNAFLFQVPVQTDGTCSLTTATKTLGASTVAPGALGGQDYAAPIVVAPVKTGTPYCLDLYFSLASGTGTSIQFGMQMTAYVLAGKYTGVGSDSATAAPVSKAAIVKGR